MTPSWWDRRTAAQVHLMAMAAIAVVAVVWAVVAGSDAVALLWPLLSVIGLVLLFVPRAFVAWRLGGRRQEQLLRQALSAVAGITAEADVDRWRPYLQSRIRQHSTAWRRSTICFMVVAFVLAGAVAWRDHPEAYWVLLGTMLLISFVGRLAETRRERGVAAPGIVDLQYVLDHLPERTDPSRVAR